MTPTPDSEHRRLPTGEADRLLARAAELDVAPGDGVTVAELRAAASEAGITARGFDAALAELHGTRQPQMPASGRSRRRPRLWAAAVGLAALVAAGALAVTRGRAPSDVSARPATSTIEQAFLLRCLAPGDAAELIRPLVADRAARVVVSPGHAPHLVTVRATPEQLREVRTVLEQHDGAGGLTCTAGATKPPPGGTS